MAAFGEGGDANFIVLSIEAPHHQKGLHGSSGIVPLSCKHLANINCATLKYLQLFKVGHHRKPLYMPCQTVGPSSSGRIAVSYGASRRVRKPQSFSRPMKWGDKVQERAAASDFLCVLTLKLAHPSSPISSWAPHWFSTKLFACLLYMQYLFRMWHRELTLLHVIKYAHDNTLTFICY